MAEELEGWGATDASVDGYASEEELDTRKLMAKKNRKKKSGGFQVRQRLYHIYPQLTYLIPIIDNCIFLMFRNNLNQSNVKFFFPKQ